MSELYFNYTPRVVNVFKLFFFCCETPGLQFSIAVSPDFSLSSVVTYRQQMLNSSFIK